MDIVQSFYDSMASHYDKLFQDWQAATREQALILDRLSGKTESKNPPLCWIVPVASAPRPSGWPLWDTK